MFKGKFRLSTIFDKIKIPAGTDVFYIKLNKIHTNQKFYHHYKSD